MNHKSSKAKIIRESYCKRPDRGEFCTGILHARKLQTRTCCTVRRTYATTFVDLWNNHEDGHEFSLVEPDITQCSETSSPSVSP